MPTAIQKEFTTNPHLVPLKKIFEAPLGEFSHFKTGGNGEVLVYPQSVAELKTLLKIVDHYEWPSFLLGDGSNILISDDGVAGVIISLKELALNATNRLKDNGLFYAHAASLTSDIAKQTAKLGLSGLHVFYGIPGTIGGACFMNASCYGVQMADFFIEAQCLDEKGHEILLKKEPNAWAYKNSPFQHAKLITLQVAFALTQSSNPEPICKEAEANYQDRIAKGHFCYPSGGSTFKNSPHLGKTAGEIIDSLGLKGFKHGGAAVSPQHANFVINENNASAQEIAELMQIIAERVKAAYNLELEAEVLKIGRFS